MPIDPKHHDKKPATRGETLTLYGLTGVFLLLMALEIFTHYEPRKLAALLFLLWWMPLVLLHEFGHALMARSFGWQIGRTVIGFGRVVYQGRLFDAPLEVRMVPIEGFVQFNPTPDTSAPRLKHALTYFAGPGIELLLFALILWGMGTDNFFTIEDDYPKLALQALAYAALTGAVINLLPMGVSTKDGDIPNDGMGILLSLFGKEKPN